MRATAFPIPRTKPNGNVTIRYEDLVGDFDSVKATLESRLGVTIPFDPRRQWADTGALEPFRTRPSWSPKYGRPIDGDGVGRFQRDLRRSEIAAVERICAALFARYGYERST